jgi:hypothetical protein
VFVAAPFPEVDACFWRVISFGFGSSFVLHGLLLVRRSVAVFYLNSNSDYIGWLIDLIAWYPLLSWCDEFFTMILLVCSFSYGFFCVSHFFLLPFRGRCTFSVTGFDVCCTLCVVWFHVFVLLLLFSRWWNLMAFRWKTDEVLPLDYSLLLGVVFFFGVLQCWKLMVVFLLVLGSFVFRWSVCFFAFSTGGSCFSLQ